MDKIKVWVCQNQYCGRETIANPPYYSDLDLSRFCLRCSRERVHRLIEIEIPISEEELKSRLEAGEKLEQILSEAS